MEPVAANQNYNEVALLSEGPPQKILQVIDASENVEKGGPSYTVGGNVN